MGNNTLGEAQTSTVEIIGSVKVFWLESFSYTTSQIHAGVKKKEKEKLKLQWLLWD